ncbi:MAG: flagellar basal body-associated protein FliL [Herminiimonas sp.]|nr:flagellar basal body-associated protein FliL [Herminiimonas sp.]
MATAPKAAAKAPKAGAEVEEVAPKKSRKKLVILIVLILLVAGGGGAVWFFLGHKDKEGAEKHAKVEAPKPPVFLVMEPFTVNLQSDGTDQFLQIGMTLQVATPEQVDLLKLYMPQVRSRLLLLLSSKRAAEINTAEGKKKLGTEIMAGVNQPFTPAGKKQEVSDVFFTSFVIQ